MIFPIPKLYEPKDGIYTFKKAPCDSDLYTFYRNCLASGEIAFTKRASLMGEAYTVEIGEGGIAIASSCEAGAFRAVTSLFHLYKRQKGKLRFAKIEDHPDFERRAYMLDISRCRMPKPKTIKQLIDLLALLKYNELQLYMENFCFKYPLFPEVTEGFECLTPEDIRELEAYCKARFIDLVPNQNCFGHMGTWLEREEYKHLEVTDGKERTYTINPLLPESNALVDKIFDSLLPYFSSEYVNIGLDEAYGLGRFQLEEYCKKYGKDTLFMENLNRIADYVFTHHGKRVQFWSDMIRSNPAAFAKMPEGAVVLEWGYELMSERKMEQHCRDLHDMGAAFYVCPSCNTHFSLTGRFEVSAYNIRTSAELGRIYGAKGCMLTDWSMDSEGHPHFPIWSYLPIALGGMYFWNVEEEQKGRIMETYFERLSRDFLDFFVFENQKVSEHIQRLANYHLLEPERVRLGTMCGMTLWQDVDKTGYGAYFDLKDCGDDFYFDNVIRYINEVKTAVTALSLDECYKAQIALGAHTVILAAELCKLRMHGTVDAEKAKDLIALTDRIHGAFKALWNEMNYEKGAECFLGVLDKRKKDLLNFIH